MDEYEIIVTEGCECNVLPYSTYGIPCDICKTKQQQDELYGKFTVGVNKDFTHKSELMTGLSGKVALGSLHTYIDDILRVYHEDALVTVRYPDGTWLEYVEHHDHGDEDRSE